MHMAWRLLDYALMEGAPMRMAGEEPVEALAAGKSVTLKYLVTAVEITISDGSGPAATSRLEWG